MRKPGAKPKPTRPLSILPALLPAAGLFFGLAALFPLPARAEIGIASWAQLAQAIATQPAGSSETYQLGSGILASVLPQAAASAGEAGDEAGAEGRTPGGESTSQPDGSAGDTAEESPQPPAASPGTIVVAGRAVVLSGGGITRAEGFTGLLFEVREGGSLTLTGGLALEGLPHQPGGGLVQVAGTGAACVVNGATLAGNAADAGSATLAVGAGGTLTLLEGQITGNSGGALLNATGATAAVVMNGGALYLNSSDTGGAVNLYEGAAFTLAGGSIEQNIAPCGGVYNDGICTVTGGGISENTATANGGGIYNNASLALAGGSITGNTAGGSGGGVYNDLAGTVYLSGGRIGASAADNALYNMSSANAVIINGQLAAPAFFTVSALGGRAPRLGDELAVKERSTGLAPLSAEEAALFTVWDGAAALPCSAVEDRVVLGAAPAQSAAPAGAPSPAGAGPQSGLPPLLPWLGLAVVAVAGAAAVVAVYVRRFLNNR